MEPKRIQAALARIETAAGRIANSARERAHGSENGDLARRHRKLREEAGAALVEIDQLILELEQ